MKERLLLIHIDWNSRVELLFHDAPHSSLWFAKRVLFFTFAYTTCNKNLYTFLELCCVLEQSVEKHLVKQIDKHLYWDVHELGETVKSSNFRIHSHLSLVLPTLDI